MSELLHENTLLKRDLAAAMRDLRQIARVLGCKDSEEKIHVPSNLPNIVRDRLSDLAEVQRSLPDDLRALGWTVAVHNDYRQNGFAHTFWLLTKGGRCVKGEGLKDAHALNCIRERIEES